MKNDAVSLIKRTNLQRKYVRSRVSLFSPRRALPTRKPGGERVLRGQRCTGVLEALPSGHRLPCERQDCRGPRAHVQHQLQQLQPIRPPLWPAVHGVCDCQPRKLLKQGQSECQLQHRYAVSISCQTKYKCIDMYTFITSTEADSVLC